MALSLTISWAMLRNGSHYTEAYTEALWGILKYDDGPALIKKHAADLDNFIAQRFKRALTNDYGPDIDPSFAEFVAKKKWLADDHDPAHWSQLPEDLRRRGFDLRTPKGGLIEEHHLLPKKHIAKFKTIFGESFDIDDFKVAIDTVPHRGEAVGLHGNGWNKAWEEFLREDRSKKAVFDYAKELVRQYALD